MASCVSHLRHCGRPAKATCGYFFLSREAWGGGGAYLRSYFIWDGVTSSTAILAGVVLFLSLLLSTTILHSLCTVAGVVLFLSLLLSTTILHSLCTVAGNCFLFLSVYLNYTSLLHCTLFSVYFSLVADTKMTESVCYKLLFPTRRS